MRKDKYLSARAELSSPALVTADGDDDEATEADDDEAIEADDVGFDDDVGVEDDVADEDTVEVADGETDCSRMLANNCLPASVASNVFTTSGCTASMNSRQSSQTRINVRQTLQVRHGYVVDVQDT